MLLIVRRQSIFHLITVLLNLFTNIYPLPINHLSAPQPKDSVFNQLLNGQDLIIHEERGVIFSRVGYYYEVDAIFGLTVTVPVTQYVCSILPMDQVEKLSLCVDYEELLRSKLQQEEISSHSSISDFLSSTNNTRFSAEKVPTKTHHRGKRFIPLIVGVVAGVLGLLFMGGVTVHNTIKGAQLSSRVSEIHRSASDTNKQLHVV
ncbi:unnamed protein product [Didymodactylos carnosus]|uniref:Uncharacterized protein n=1 Tax=Didymodactylos carnosus TaxID=1234261 RepID=A0A8S2D034_9BILA|nr:unnamed protein product [Didymodactylos carnosus]CAF3551672.1 unnamed protein product [Didymodactylos carnosus]